jgi:hypothetical protein
LRVSVVAILAALGCTGQTTTPSAPADASDYRAARIKELGPLLGCTGVFPIKIPAPGPPETEQLVGVYVPDPAVKTRLSAATIQAEIQAGVRAKFDEFRACYEEGLTRNPRLAGKVTTTFVIERNGFVTAVAIAESSIPDCAVPLCMVKAFRSLEFPKPDGGIVKVTYPIMFSPN